MRIIVRVPVPDRAIPDPLPPLLFNIAEDPFERHDLAEQHPQRVAALEADLERWFIDVTGILTTTPNHRKSYHAVLLKLAGATLQ